LVLGPTIAWAAEAAAPSGLDLKSLWKLVIPIAVPILIAGAKYLIPMLPGWLIPIVAPLLGGIADALVAWLAAVPANPVLGLILGSAGVGVREVADQLKQKIAPQP